MLSSIQTQFDTHRSQQFAFQLPLLLKLQSSVAEKQLEEYLSTIIQQYLFLLYILLIIFTLCFSTVVAAPCIICFQLLSNGVQLVIIAASITLAITILLTLYAWKTKTDYSASGHLCFVLSVSLLIMCIVGLFIRNIWFHLFICTICIIIYGGYIIFDTQIIIGNHSNYLSIDDYVIAAMLLYIDIVILFLRILEILIIIFGKN